MNAETGRVLIIGAGGVGSVVTHKCAWVPEVFADIWLASRTKEKCDRIMADVRQRTGRTIHTAKVDADNVTEVVELIKRCQPTLVINTALPFQDLSIMEGCLATGVNYLDTANYESPDEAKFCYQWQWDYHERFQEKGLMALLGSGFDPGVTNVFCAHAQKHHFDAINTIEILDANGGDHGHPFATNFNPEINIREVTARGKYYQDGKWLETEPLSVHQTFDFPGIGPREAYLMNHEELESLARHIKGVGRIRFWMTFSENYLRHLEVLRNVGMTGIEPVEFEGQQIVPLKFLKALLPEPASLGAVTKGRTCIGCVIQGQKAGVAKKIYIYNICDHEACFKDVGSQAISYTTGVPAMIGAMLMMTGVWRGAGVFNMEQLDPDPFMDKLMIHGLPWVEKTI